MHVLPCICNNSVIVSRIDIIGMVLAISPLERTRNRGTIRQELLFVIDNMHFMN